MVRHDVRLRGLGLNGEGEGPTILARTDADFIKAILAELKRDDHLARLSSTVATTRIKDDSKNPPLKLFPPVQHTYNVAVLEAVCDAFGEPRFDPAQIESAGLVVRRFSDGGMQGWMSADGVIHGWQDLSPIEYQDPDPRYRQPLLSAGHPVINREIAIQQRLREFVMPLEESVTPLFMAPPDVCKAAKKTVLYGLIPVTSTETSGRPALPPEDGREQLVAELPKLFPTFLSTRSIKDKDNKIIRYRAISYYGPIQLHGDAINLVDEPNSITAELIAMVRRLIELGAFDGTPEAEAFLTTLNIVQLELTDFVSGKSYKLGAGEMLRNTAAFLLAEQDQESAEDSESAFAVVLQMVSVKQTTTWTIGKKQSNAIFERLADLILARQAELTAGERRFDTRGGRYQLRAFIRVRRPDGCPPKTVWSAPSETFAIAPWFESSGVPPVPIELPNPFDRNALKNAKPNVALKVPKELMGFMQKYAPEDIIDGNAEADGIDLTLDWICGLNIPFVTICAFIVLSIFLSLLDLVFQWLAYIRVCIPVPK